MTQAGCYQLVLDRKLGEYVLPDGWVVIAAGNPASERGVHFSMPRPLRNRFVHLELEADLNDWCKVGRGRGRAAGDHRLSALQAGPAARGRHNLGRQCLAHSALLGDGLHVLCGVARRQNTAFLTGAGEFEAQLLDGTVGQAASAELLAFLRLFRQLPSIDEILLNPESAPLPTETSAQIAISTALGRVMTDSSIARGLKYLDRMPAEMRVMAMRDAAARDTRHHPHAGVHSLRHRAPGR
jgi:hypothetical protein